MRLTRSRRFSVAGVLGLVLSVLLGVPAHGQPADESAAAMDARLAAATVNRVGPSYLYPAHKTAPGLVNPDITKRTSTRRSATRSGPRKASAHP